MRSVLPLLVLGAVSLPSVADAAIEPLDTFESLDPWEAAASDGVASVITPVPGAEGKALRLEYDFRDVSGYAYTSRASAIDWPGNFRLTLKVKGEGAVNDLQIKFVDETGENVWWHVIRNFRPSPDWQTITLRPRDIDFAWGPTGVKELSRTARIELVVVHGRDGGAGHLDFDDLELTPLEPKVPLPDPVATRPELLDDNAATGWDARPGGTARIDFGGSKELGGLILEWDGPAPAYDVEGSLDGERWTTLAFVRGGDGDTDALILPDTELRYLRVLLPENAAPARLVGLTVEPLAFGDDPNALVTRLAERVPRGTFPRGFTEQPYWTLVGTPDGGPSGLIGEDGNIEVAKGGFSLEPFVLAEDGTRISWADVKESQSLEDGYLPIPHVRWIGQAMELDTAVLADTAAPRLVARYRLTNTATVRRQLRLIVAIRPFQVNPPAQFLSQQGGVARISSIAWDGERLVVTSPGPVAGDPVIQRTVMPLVQPDAVATAPFAQGVLGRPAALTGGAQVSDPAALASATLAFSMDLAPGESADIPVAIPFGSEASDVDRSGWDTARTHTIAAWREQLDRVRITVPPAKLPVADTVKTALAHILMSRDGPALKPGTRSYDRAWIRDGAMIADTLLRLGVAEPVERFADWYTSKLFDNGKVPCCVDARGADPVAENDAQGEFIHLWAQRLRYTGDRAAASAAWPRIVAAWRYMEDQRNSTRTPKNLAPENRYKYGLMPRSISHEGYSSEPQYSLWDDFWALTGYKDMVWLAGTLGHSDVASLAAVQRDQFAADIAAAIGASVDKFEIDYIPGATSLGDFDATSTTIALDPAGAADLLDPRLLANTFDGQYARVTSRPARTDWEDYTPYELRNVSALVRLGRRGQANDLLDLYMQDRRPAAWNGWAEVVGRTKRETRFLGDLPHAWVASDFIRAALDLFAYRREQDEAIVLGAGLTRDWLTGEGSTIQGLATPYGTLNFAMRIEGDRLVAKIDGDAMPPGGFVLPWPIEEQAGAVIVNGQAARFDPDGLHVSAAGRPIEIRVALLR